MDDIKQTYFDDLKEKSTIARSARQRGHKGQTGKYTKKEVCAMNGPEYTVNVNRFIAYEEFKLLPDTLKKEYLQGIIVKWKIGSAAISRMWGLTSGTINPLMKRLGVKSCVKHATPKDTERFFNEFVKPKEKEVSNAGMRFCGSSVCFTGFPNEQAVMRQLEFMIPSDIPVKITITVEAEQ